MILDAPPAANRGALRSAQCNEPEIWDAAVESLGGSLLQTWSWGEFKSRHGWRARRLLVTQDDRPVAAAQLLFRRKGPISVAYAPRGPLVAPGQPEARSALTIAIDQACRRQRAVLALIEPEASDCSWTTLGRLSWAATDLLIQPRRTIKLRVDRSDVELLDAMKPKTRYNVRLAERRGVEVRAGGLPDLPAFYQMLRETAERDEFGIHDFDYFADLLRTFGERSALLLAEWQGQPAAGLLVVRARGEAIYLYGASNTELQKHMGAYLVQFAAMRWARDAGCELYDLWGIPAEDAPPEAEQGTERGLNVRAGMWGVYRFKQGFGGSVVTYPGIYERSYAGALISLGRRLGLGLGVGAG